MSKKTLFKMNKLLLSSICSLVIYSGVVLGQPNYPNINPWITSAQVVIPEAYNFIKYGEIPVSEYTGTANIIIPLFQIKAHETEIPIALSYFSGGIRVSEEASWAGLGWDIQLGSVVQIINGLDDFDETYPMNIPEYVTGRSYPADAIWYNCANPSSFNNQVVAPWFSYVRFESQLMPKRNSPSCVPFDFDLGHQDSEPDIMKANFFGHSIQFLKDPFATYGSYPVLNKKGYQVTKILLVNNNFGWKITVPDGTQYYFEEVNITNTSGDHNMLILGDYNTVFKSASSNNIINSVNWTSSVISKSRIWKITKILTVEYDTIQFNYSNPTNITDYNIENQWNIYKGEMTDNNLNNVYNAGPIVSDLSRALYSNYYDDILIRKASSTTSSTYLTSIDFNDGIIYFYTSDRSDCLGLKKLDRIRIYNKPKNTLIKTIDFSYSYFNSSTPSLGFPCPKSENELDLRLKLEWVKEEGMPPFIFTYDSELLPRKNSYAVDYWGFYNGKVSNTSFLPNPLSAYPDQSQQYAPFLSVLNKNNNDNSSYLMYSRACTLKEIVYPTGGKTCIEYELNSFNNYYLGSSTPSGQGLRVASVSNWESTTQISKVKYNYQGGKTMIPPVYIFSFGDCEIIPPSYGFGFRKYVYNNNIVRSTNLYAPNQLGSGNYVGYDMVIITQEGTDNGSNGSTERYYTNASDYIPFKKDIQFKFVLPSHKNEIENGLVYKEIVKNSNSDLLKITTNYYHFVQNADPFYGAKFMLSGQFGDINMSPQMINPKRYDIAAYYPIIQTETLLDSTKVEQINNNQTIITRQYFEYNTINLPSAIKRNTSKNEWLITRILYPNEASSSSEFTSQDQYIFYLLSCANRLSEKALVNEYKNSSCLSKTKFLFKQSGTMIVPASISKYDSNSTLIDRLSFDLYDTYGNLVEYTENNGLKTTMVWAYNHYYPVLKVVSDALNTSSNYTTLSNNISQILGSTSLETLLSVINSPTDGAWKSFNQQLRLLMPNSVIHSYTYKPLVGLLSSTDENGNSIYYDYDFSNRLKLKRNDKNEITDRFYYHFYTDPGTDTPTLDINPSTLSIPSNTLSGSFLVTSNCSWNIASNAYWLTANQASGSGNASIGVSTMPNNGTARSGTITVTYGSGLSKNLMVTQAAADLSLDQTSIILPFTASSGLFSIYSNCNWSINTSATWLSVSPSSAGGSANISVTATANSGAARNATLTITYAGGLTKTVSVTQAGVELTLSPTNISLPGTAASTTFSISSNCTWSISDNASWLSVNPTSGTGNATITVSVTANASAARNATITIAYGGGLTKTVSVSQAAGSASRLLVSPMTINYGSVAPLVTVTVTSNTSWTVTKSASWITISATSGTGNGTITVRATKLLSGTRSGTVTFKTSDNTVTRIINIYQDSGLIQQ